VLGNSLAAGGQCAEAVLLRQRLAAASNVRRAAARAWSGSGASHPGARTHARKASATAQNGKATPAPLQPGLTALLDARSVRR